MVDLNALASVKNLLATRTDMTFSVDYNDGAAVDPPAGTVFRTQQEVDDFLSSEGATNFKHLMGVYDTLPKFVLHNITFELAAGVHRPRSGQSGNTAWPLTGKQLIGGTVSINGGDFSSFVVDAGPFTVTAYQQDNDDPYLDFSGTPFAGQDYKGLFVRLSTGQVAVIHDHTDSRLNTVEQLSPNPVGATAEIVRPGTILRNSFDDVSRAYSSSAIDVDFESTAFALNFFQRLQVDGFSPNFRDTIVLETAIIVPLYMLWDHQYQDDNFGISSFSGVRPLQVNGLCIAIDSAMRGNGTGDSPVLVTGTGANLSLQHFTAYNFPDQPSAQLESSLFLYNTVFDTVDTVDISERSKLVAQDVFPGKPSTIRNISGVGLDLSDRSFIDAFTFTLWFENITGSCVTIGTLCVLDMTSATLGFQDGGGNSDVGVELIGSRATVFLDSNTNVTGSNGDFKFSDGDIKAYTELETSGPFTDSGLNLVSKAS